jgi:hypothetical protein
VAKLPRLLFSFFGFLKLAKRCVIAPFLTLQTVKKLVSKKENKHSAPADVEI